MSKEDLFSLASKYHTEKLPFILCSSSLHVAATPIVTYTLAANCLPKHCGTHLRLLKTAELCLYGAGTFVLSWLVNITLTKLAQKFLFPPTDVIEQSFSLDQLIGLFLSISHGVVDQTCLLLCRTWMRKNSFVPSVTEYEQEAESLALGVAYAGAATLLYRLDDLIPYFDFDNLVPQNFDRVDVQIALALYTVAAKSNHYVWFLSSCLDTLGLMGMHSVCSLLNFKGQLGKAIAVESFANAVGYLTSSILPSYTFFPSAASTCLFNLSTVMYLLNSSSEFKPDDSVFEKEGQENESKSKLDDLD